MRSAIRTPRSSEAADPAAVGIWSSTRSTRGGAGRRMPEVGVPDLRERLLRHQHERARRRRAARPICRSRPWSSMRPLDHRGDRDRARGRRRTGTRGPSRWSGRRGTASAKVGTRHQQQHRRAQRQQAGGDQQEQHRADLVVGARRRGCARRRRGCRARSCRRSCRCPRSRAAATRISTADATTPNAIATRPQRRDPRRNTTKPRAATVRPRSSLTRTSGSAQSTAAGARRAPSRPCCSASSGTPSATSWKSKPNSAPKPGASP